MPENKHAPRNDYTKQTSNVFCLYPHVFRGAQGEELFLFSSVPLWDYSQTTNKLRLVQ